MLNEAIILATQAHEGQTRKNSGLPYIVHPLEVMQILIESGVTSRKVLSIAVLHDVIEDCPEYIQQVANLNDDVYLGVCSLTKEADEESTLVKLAMAPAYVQLVKVADIIANTRSGEIYRGYYKKKARQLRVMTAISTDPLYSKAWGIVN